MFCSTVISGNSARFWKISAVGRMLGPRPASDRAPSRISPSLGSMKPEIMRRMVVLPQPDGPRNEKNSPSLMVRLRLRTAVKLPKRFTTLDEVEVIGHGRLTQAASVGHPVAGASTPATGITWHRA